MSTKTATKDRRSKTSQSADASETIEPEVVDKPAEMPAAPEAPEYVPLPGEKEFIRDIVVIRWGVDHPGCVERLDALNVLAKEIGWRHVMDPEGLDGFTFNTREMTQDQKGKLIAFLQAQKNLKSTVVKPPTPKVQAADPAALMESVTPAGDRKQNGRFAPGNRAAVGHAAPYARKVAWYRDALMESVTPADVRNVAQVLLKKALGGDVKAIRELLDRLLGIPDRTVWSLDNVDKAEREALYAKERLEEHTGDDNLTGLPRF